MKRNLTILGMAVTAMLAMAAMSAASASASFPKFVATEGTLPFTFTASGKEGRLETVGGSIVTCTSSTGSGEIVNSETEPIKNTTITFEGCTSVVLGFPVNCTTSGQGTGVIKTKVLRGQVDYPRVRPEEEGVLLRLFPKEETNKEWIFATFNCSFVTITVRTNGNSVTGGVLGVLEPINTSTGTFTLSFQQKRNEKGEIEQGIQEFTSWLGNPALEKPCEEGTAAFLETKVGGGEWEQSAIEDLKEANKITLGEKQKGEIQASECT